MLFIFSGDKPIFGLISRSLISYVDGLFRRSLHVCRVYSITMLVNGYCDQYMQQCPVVGRFEEPTWNMQCPMSGQWPKLMNNVSSFGLYGMNFTHPVQCYTNDQYQPICENMSQYYPNMYPTVVQTVQPPIMQNLPCQQSQNWDYNSMCYNVNGQPCQYTNVVDLEDFM